MALIVEVLGPPAAGKSTLGAELGAEFPVVPEQLPELHAAGALPPAGPERQLALARAVERRLRAAGPGPVLVDSGWAGLVLFGWERFAAEDAAAVARAVEDAAGPEHAYLGVVWLDAPADVLRARAAADPARTRAHLEPNLELHRGTGERLRLAERLLPPGFVLRPDGDPAVPVRKRLRDRAAWLSTADLLGALAPGSHGSGEGR